MTNGQRTITALLAVIAELLAANLATSNERPAEAAAPDRDGNPYIVKFLLLDQTHIYRAWSDGQADVLEWTGYPSCVWEPHPIGGPVDHPFPVVDAVLPANEMSPAVMMTFEDGRVDYLLPGIRCTMAGIGSQSFCTADVNRDGAVNVTDFLTMLAQWGPCAPAG